MDQLQVWFNDGTSKTYAIHPDSFRVEAGGVISYELSNQAPGAARNFWALHRIREFRLS